MTNELYYIRNKNAGYLGNAWIWWGRNSQGYTAYLNGAGRYTKQEADEICQNNPEKNIAYKCSEIDERLHLVFDSQDAKRIGDSDKSSGWNFPYAERKNDE